MSKTFMVDMTTRLQEWLGVKLSPSVFREMGTINATTHGLVENQKA